jgi:hypothetical protein
VHSQCGHAIFGIASADRRRTAVPRSTARTPAGVR